MNRVGGVGRPPAPGDKQPDKKPQKKKSKDAPKFDDVLKKKGAADDGAAGAGGKKGKGLKRNSEGVKGAGGDAAGKGAPGAKKPGQQDDAVQFTLNEGEVRKGQKKMQTYQRETVKQEKMAEDSAGAVGQTEQAATVRHDAGQVQEAKAASLPPELVQKLVESVRVGQNRVGATEMQLGLKATVFEGMNLKISSKDGIVQVVMEVEQLAAKEKLESEISQLQDRLEEQGLSVGDISVELKGSGGGGPGAQGGDAAGEETSSPYGGEAGGPQGPGGADSTAPDTQKKPDSSTDYTL